MSQRPPTDRSAGAGRNSCWHLITGEYPPQPGGVSDYTHRLAGGLAAAGDSVHVWCPPAGGATPAVAGVQVHRTLGTVSVADLRRTDALLERFPAPRRLLVQWVPQAFGFYSLNLAFPLWLWRRSARGERRAGCGGGQRVISRQGIPFRSRHCHLYRNPHGCGQAGACMASRGGVFE